jgi:hypothetical protein
MKEFGEFDMTKYTFVPFIKIHLYNSEEAAHFDIISDENKPNYSTNAWEPIEVDITKLSRYFSIRLMSIHYENQIYYNFHHSFRKCRSSDFSEGIWE